MDRQKAALVVVRIEQRELLMAVRDIAGVVNIENDAGRRAFVRRHPLIDERVGQADRVFQRRRILHPRQRRLRAQIAARLGQAAARQLECRIGSQKVEIVGVLVAAGDGVDARPDHVSTAMKDACGIAHGSEKQRASRSATPSRRSAIANSITPPSEVRRPPSKKRADDFRRPGWLETRTAGELVMASGALAG